MEDAHDRRRAVFPGAEPDDDVDEHAQRRHEYGDDGVHLQLVAHGRTELLGGQHIRLVYVEDLADGIHDIRPLVVLQGLNGSYDDLLVVLTGVDDGWMQVEGIDRILHFAQIDLLAHIDLQHGPTGKVYAVVQAADDAEDEAHHQDGDADGIVDFSMFDE